MYIESIYSTDPDLEIFARENAIECSICEKEISENLSLLNEIIFFESGDNAEKKEQNIIKRIGNAIRKMIDSVTDFISRMFKSVGAEFGEKLTAPQYLKSDQVKVRLKQDLDKVYEETEKQIREGHTILNKISDSTPFSYETIEKWYDKVSNFIIDNSGTIISATATTVVANKINDSLKTTSKLQAEVKRKTTVLETEKEIISDTKAKIKKEEGHKVMSALQKVSGGFGIIQRRLTSSYCHAKKQLDSVKENYKKQSDRKNKKK